MIRQQISILVVGCVLLFGISGCSKKSGGDSGGAANNNDTNVQQDPAEGSTWDQMVWDRGRWG